MSQRLFALLITLTLASLLGADWPHWRGPQRNGVSSEVGWLDTWPVGGPKVAWKANVGVGFSSFAVAERRLFTMGYADGQDMVRALDADTGKELWKHAYAAELGDVNFEGGPTATPTVVGGHVFTLSRWGDVFCFDAATGKVVWSRNIIAETKAGIPSWGFSGSPLVVDQLVFLNIGKTGLALDKATGKTAWKSDENEAGYSTPLPFRLGDKNMILFSSEKSYSAVEPTTGAVAWSLRWPTRYGVNAADPIVVADEMLISSGYGKGVALCKMSRGEPTILWQNKTLKNQFNSSVLLDGFLYGIDGDTSEEPTLKCVEWKTGKERWKKGDIGSGSLIAADGRLIVLSEGGVLLVGKASPEGFAPTAKHAVLGGRCWTPPVLANGRIYCRNADGDLVAVDVRKDKP